MVNQTGLETGGIPIAERFYSGEYAGTADFPRSNKR
jgi:hypothetical protein